MAESRSIPVAFVGLGRIASLLEHDPLREKPATHAGAVAADPRCFIAGGFDREPDRRDAFANAWGTATFDSFHSLVTATRPEILVVATHPDSHEEYLRRAVQSGVPVAICEKPLADTSRGARRIVRLESSGKIRIVVNHERRFSRDYRLAREAIRDRRFGPLLGVNARLYFGGSARHDRVLLHDGTHILDAINFLVGERVTLHRRVGVLRSRRSSVYLHGSTRPSGSSVSSRVPVSIEIGAERDYLLFEIVLSFGAGEIRLGNGEFQWRESRPSPHYRGYRSLQDLRRTVPYPTGYFSGMIAEATRLVLDPTAVSRSPAAEARWVIREIARARRLL